MPALSQGLEFVTYTNTASIQVVYPLFTSTQETLVYKSIKAKGDGYYGGSDGLHTVMYTYDSNFVGTVTMQATLATDPGETDWFNIADTTTELTENSVNYNNIDVTVQSEYRNFTGNFVWVRGYVAIDSGQVQSIFLNH
jgi:hypothetical protein